MSCAKNNGPMDKVDEQIDLFAHTSCFSVQKNA